VLWTLRDAIAPPFASRGAEDRRANLPSADGPTDARAVRGNLAALFSADDYPTEALRREEQGTVTADLRVDESGRVSRCTVSGSSGSTSLDATTCDILRHRARFAPATNGSGQAIPGSYSQRITWRLEG
jgi:periplasmic protein TonB